MRETQNALYYTSRALVARVYPGSSLIGIATTRIGTAAVGDEESEDSGNDRN